MRREEEEEEEVEEEEEEDSVEKNWTESWRKRAEDFEGMDVDGSNASRSVGSGRFSIA